jgi:hypothetical protein
LIDEICYELLVDDLNGKTFVTKGKTFTCKAVISDEFQDFKQPTVAVLISDHSPGYGGMHNQHSIDSDGNMNYSKEMRAEVELRVSACEYKSGNTVINARDVTSDFMKMVKQRVRASWNRILIDYNGSVVASSIQGERDYQDFTMGNKWSYRLMRFVIRYEESWNNVLPEDEAFSATPVEGIIIRAEDDNDLDVDQDLDNFISN